MTLRTYILGTLILVGAAGIAASLVVRYALPFNNELKLEKLDEQRISDLNALDAAIKVALPLLNSSNNSAKVSDVESELLSFDPKEATPGLGNVVYISTPSPSPTCSDLKLPSLPEHWKYHCVTAQNLTKTDGTGWLTLNFDKYSPGKFTSLPIDPVNDADTLSKYAYIQDCLGIYCSYVLTSILDSKKNKNTFSHAEDSADPFRYVIGSNKPLWVEANGLEEYIPFDDRDNDSLIVDALHPELKFGLSDNSQYMINSFGEGPVLNFKGNSSIDFSPTSENKTKSISVVSRVNITALPQNAGIFQRGNAGNSAFNYGLFIRGDVFSFTIKNLTGEITVKSQPIARQWHTVVGTFDDQKHNLALYINGKLSMENISASGIDYEYTPPFQIGGDSSNYLDGQMSYVALYNRILLSSEIDRL